MKFFYVFLLALVPLVHAGGGDHFTPTDRVSGIGISRDDISDELLDARTDRMIESQTFSIMREPQALPGAKRVTGDAKLQALFRSAAAASGMPASIVEAICYLESWGDPKAQSITGPRGIMQISGATAVSMGLKVAYATRYKTTREKVPVKAKGKSKTTYRTVSHKTPYKVLVRDDRMVPERAIPAAARYLAGMEQEVRRARLGHFRLPLRTGLRRRDAGNHAARARHSGRQDHGAAHVLRVQAPRGIANCTMPSSSRCSATIRRPTISASCAPSSCWRSTAATRKNSQRLAQEYKSEFVAHVRAPHRLSRVAQAGRPGVPHRRGYSRRHRPEAGESPRPARILRLHR